MIFRSASPKKGDANFITNRLLTYYKISFHRLSKSGEYRRYYERKIAEGKHPMSVLNVVRAKLVSRMFAVVRRDSEYQKNYVFSNSLEKIPA